MKEDVILRKIIRSFVTESLGKLKTRAFHGGGSAHPYQVKSLKQQLGQVEMPENELTTPQKNVVAISRAFKTKTKDLT